MLTTIRCPGCGEFISISVEGTPECGGDGEGTCDACFDESIPSLLHAIFEAQQSALVFLGFSAT